MTVIRFEAVAYVETEGMTEQQVSRLMHHAEISRQVFRSSIAGMAKGVQKYPSEPVRKYQAAYWRDVKAVGDVQRYWLPHIFSEAVDCANQTGLFADALGVELCQTDN